MAKPMDQYKWHELKVGCVIAKRSVMQTSTKQEIGVPRSLFMTTQSVHDARFAGYSVPIQQSSK